MKETLNRKKKKTFNGQNNQYLVLYMRRANIGDFTLREFCMNIYIWRAIHVNAFLYEYVRFMWSDSDFFFVCKTDGLFNINYDIFITMVHNIYLLEILVAKYGCEFVIFYRWLWDCVECQEMSCTWHMGFNLSSYIHT